MNESNQIQGITYLPFHTKNFWDDFYSKKGNETINWYFDITKIDFPDFSVKKLTTNDEILLLGPGTSSLLDYLYSNNFEKICIYDFSPELIKNLKKNIRIQIGK